MRYLVALGSNQRHFRHGNPRAVIAAAVLALDEAGLGIVAVSRTIASRPLGPSARLYANAAAMIDSALEPPELLSVLHGIENAFGRRRRGQPWRARVLDLDIVLWEGGCWAEPGLTIPHVAWRERSFVLTPARQIARDWRDPLGGGSIAQHHARLTRPRALPKPPASRPCRRAGP